ncbi:ABC transporter ATPase [Faecalibacter bovis]|uniref:ABC transporter ATPase n=1 Tax=Faecalibacter bovis TaxID=2898187 RepID=A0ABX7XDR9_9FLAO|nr:ABC transporter ATPase [Faecalibacter bovis]QTV06076.1 ABC transporter ATPase [Faecalibacter bovis]
MNLADDSRIWIFQANRKFSSEEKDIITAKLKNFIADWNAHGAALLADFDLPYDQFIVVGVDEKQASASGCSIDKLTKIIRELDSEYNFEFLNRMLIAFEENENIKIEKLPTFKSKVKEGLYNNIKVFNNGISNLADYKSSWVLPIEKSWANTLLS